MTPQAFRAATCTKSDAAHPFDWLYTSKAISKSSTVWAMAQGRARPFSRSGPFNRADSVFEPYWNTLIMLAMGVKIKPSRTVSSFLNGGRSEEHTSELQSHSFIS